MNIDYENNIYIIDGEFRLVEFDRAVADRYPGIRIGDLCYRSIMKRETPCAHCPIAECSDNASVVYYDALFDGYVEAAFCELTGGKYCVTRHKVGVESEHMKKQIERSVGFFEAYSHVFVSTYYVDFLPEPIRCSIGSGFWTSGTATTTSGNASTITFAPSSTRTIRRNCFRPAALKPCARG